MPSSTWYGIFVQTVELSCNVLSVLLFLTQLHALWHVQVLKVLCCLFYVEVAGATHSLPLPSGLENVI